MKSASAVLSLTAVLSCAAASALAAPPIIGKPNLRVAPQVRSGILVLRPDYAVKSIDQTVTNGKIEKLTITIVDLCNTKLGAAPYVTVNAYAILGYNAGFGGANEHVQVLTLGSNVPAGTKIRVSVNDDKAAPEAWSGNNFLEKNPDIAPFPPGKNYCLPENYEN